MADAPKQVSTPRKHHYVWRGDTAKWGDADGQVFFSRNGVVRDAPTNPRNLMAQRDFYRLPDLSMDALVFVAQLVRQQEDPDLRSPNETILNLYAQFLVLKAEVDGSASTPLEERERVERIAIRLHELYFSNLEGTVAPIVDSLRDGSTAVLRNRENRYRLYLFLGLQLLRTKKLRGQIDRILRDPSLGGHRFASAEAEGIAMLCAQIYGQTIGHSLYLRSDEYRSLVLENEAEESFITGDQPLLNLLAPEEGVPQELALYYPLSPRRAFLLLEKKVARRFAAVCSEAVRDLNLCTAAAAHETFVGDSAGAIRNIEQARPFRPPDMRRWLVA